MSGANQHEAGRQAAALLRRSMPGTRRGVVRHVRRAERIGAAIWRRWHLLPSQWQTKHIRWYVAVETRDLAQGTRYDHWRTVRALVAALGRLEDWIPHLRGSWVRPTGDQAPRDPDRGGRPPRLPGGPRP